MSTFSSSPVSRLKRSSTEVIRKTDRLKCKLISWWPTCLSLNSMVSMRWALWRRSSKGNCSGKMMRSGPLRWPDKKSVNFSSKSFPRAKCVQKMNFKEWSSNFFLCKNNPKTKSTNWPHCWTKNATASSWAKTQKTNSKRPTSNNPTIFLLKSPNFKGPTAKARTKSSASNKNWEDWDNLFSRWLPLRVCLKRNLQERMTNCWRTENLLRKSSDFLNKISMNWQPDKRRPYKNSIKPHFTTKSSSNHSHNSQSKIMTSSTIQASSKDSSTKKTKKSSS